MALAPGGPGGWGGALWPALIALAAAAPAAWLVARFVTRPVSELAAAAASIAAGEHDASLPLGAAGELGTLAAALERLTAAARDRTMESAAEQDKLRAVLNGIIEGVLAVDLEERVIHCNAPAAAMLHITQPEPESHHLWAVTRLNDVCEVLRACIRTGEDASREVRAFEGPRARTIQVRAAVLRDLHGIPAGAVAVLHDVTQAARVQALRRDFVADVSHELKTPITAVRGQIETILDDPEMAADRRRSFLEKVRLQTLRLSDIVGDLLTISRLESAESPLEAVPLDLRDPVRTTVAGLREPAETRGVTLRADLPDAAVTVRGDLPALEQAIRNLADNGVKYTPGGGFVTIRVGVVHGWAQVDVEDTGPGIPAEHRERVFERFYRVDKARRARRHRLGDRGPRWRQLLSHSVAVGAGGGGCGVISSPFPGPRIRGNFIWAGGRGEYVLSSARGSPRALEQSRELVCRHQFRSA
ncbi:MAG: sensor histidine kinase [Planctomycetota bacterium]